MYHTVNLGAHLVENLLDDRCVGAGGGEDKLAGINGGTIDGISQVVLAAVDEFVGHSVVVALRIAFGEVFGENVVAG